MFLKNSINLVYESTALLFQLIWSKVAIILLRLRGFDIHHNVSLVRSSFFFRSRYGRIYIKKGVKIGQYVEIKSGYKGIIIINKDSEINRFSIIDIQKSLYIGKNVLIAPYCYITDYDHAYDDKNRSIQKQEYIRNSVVIHDNVWIGAHSIILKGVTIGKGAIIGAGSVVTGNIPPYTIAVGCPARVIKKH